MVSFIRGKKLFKPTWPNVNFGGNNCNQKFVTTGNESLTLLWKNFDLLVFAEQFSATLESLRMWTGYATASQLDLKLHNRTWKQKKRMNKNLYKNVSKIILSVVQLLTGQIALPPKPECLHLLQWDIVTFQARSQFQFRNGTLNTSALQYIQKMQHLSHSLVNTSKIITCMGPYG